MTTELTERKPLSLDLQEKALIGGDLSKLTVQERLSYYANLCESLELNPLTRPFEYLVLSGKTVLYARKDCTEQLRTKKHISVIILSREVVEGVYVVTARATDPTGRTDESIGAVPIDKLIGNDRANAMMKAETKAKRRVTLSICGLGMLDETEIDTIKDAKPAVLIPQVRPPSGDHDYGLPVDKYTGEPIRQEDGVGHDAASTSHHVVTPASHDAPAPSSAKAFCDEQAAKAGNGELTAEGYVGTYQPRLAGKTSPPGKLTLDTLRGELVLQFWDKPTGLGEANHRYAKVVYRVSKNGRFTNNELLHLTWTNPPQ